MPNLIHSRHSIRFFCQAVRSCFELSLNRIGTHLVENLVSLVRVACPSDHSWHQFLDAIANGRLMDEMLLINDTNPRHRRDCSVVGLKREFKIVKSSIWLFQRSDIEDFVMSTILQDPWLNLQQAGGCNWCQCCDRWISILQILVHWTNCHHFAQLYSPGPIASEIAFSTIINITRSAPFFRWTKRWWMKVVYFQDDPKNSFDYSGSQLSDTLHELIECCMSLMRICHFRIEQKRST
jgi:hypothetical protein